MTSNGAAISEAELNAFCDGELNEAEAARVAAAIEADPALRARMARIMGDLAALRAAAEPEVDDPATLLLAERLSGAVARRERQRTMAQYGAGLAATVAIACGGWFGHAAFMKSSYGKRQEGLFLTSAIETQPVVPTFVADAAGAHQVFAPDNFHPVEFTAENEAAMARWFSDRLGESAAIPHLEELGFNLVGGRLLAGAEGPRAQVMYENAKGDRVSLVFGKQRLPGDAKLKLVHVGKSYASYWQDSGMDWAVVEDTPGADVSQVATFINKLTKE
ncbi:MAG: anti-sigma factor [Pseudomonadota bacterium]